MEGKDICPQAVVAVNADSPANTRRRVGRNIMFFRKELLDARRFAMSVPCVTGRPSGTDDEADTDCGKPKSGE
jgi:hypothetical protein